jgi:hypothetical protein
MIKNGRWTAIEGVRGYFDKMTEELVDPARLAASPNPFTQGIARAYSAYKAALFANNRIRAPAKHRPWASLAARP